MPIVTIELSDKDALLAREYAARYEFANVEEYLRELVSSRLHGDNEGVVDWGTPEHLRVTSKEQLTALILEGMESPAREITEEDWAQMRRELIERHRGEQ